MSDNTTTPEEVAEIGTRLIDEAYTNWLTAENQATEALEAWFEAGPGGGAAYYTYLAALDREEAAALDLQRLWQVAAPCQDALVGRARTAAS